MRPESEREVKLRARVDCNAARTADEMWRAKPAALSLDQCFFPKRGIVAGNCAASALSEPRWRVGGETRRGNGRGYSFSDIGKTPFELGGPPMGKPQANWQCHFPPPIP